MKIDFYRVSVKKELTARTYSALNKFKRLFPKDPKASILIKPNLNSTLDALTGNTTDLRVLALLIEYLKDEGYSNISIGEGYNSGFHRDKISVIERNKVDRLAKFYGINVIDFNYAEGFPIDFEDGIRPLVAKHCFNADFFINVPKLKMHYETMMSVCLKSLIGTLVGLENKTLVHKSLIKNILHINDNVKPHLHVVDALFAMEGTGPSAGTPVKMNMLIIGDNPYIVDMLCARLFCCEYEEVPLLKESISSGRINSDMIQYVESLRIDTDKVKAKRPNPNFIARQIINPRYQKYFIMIRNAPVISNVISNVNVKKVLLRFGITQEVIVKKERHVKLGRNSEKCCGCGRCDMYCPIHLNLPDDIENAAKMSSCIDCLYCYAVCPNNAIVVEGELGYYTEQIRRYGKIIKEMA